MSIIGESTQILVSMNSFVRRAAKLTNAEMLTIVIETLSTTVFDNCYNNNCGSCVIAADQR